MIDPLYERAFHCPNCLHLSLFVRSYHQKVDYDTFVHCTPNINWSGTCAKCQANVEVSQAKSSAVLDTLSYQYLEQQNLKLSKENQALKAQLDKVKELVK